MKLKFINQDFQTDAVNSVTDLFAGQEKNRVMFFCLESWQSSVGTAINVSHTAASPIGAVISVTAAVEYVFGRKIEFSVTATDSRREIGKGKHTRMIVDIERFMKKIGTAEETQYPVEYGSER